MLTTTATPVRKAAWLIFISLSLCYLALAPGSTAGRGYVPEDLQSGLGLLASFNAWMKGRPVPPIMWTRHGPVPILLDLPFIKLGKLFISPDFVLSLQPLLLTAALMALVYLWLRKLCTPAMSLLLTVIGAFGTMLWPYAYIGLETKQSFFVLLAGYLGLARGKLRTWPQLLLFSTICALAISVKSTGIVFVPPIAYLVYVQFRHDWRSQWNQALTVSLIVTGLWALGAIGWNFFWRPFGGGANALQGWTTNSLFQFFVNAIGIFGSPTKGVFIFAPVLLFGIYAVPRALRTHRETAIFGLLVTACIVAFLSILIVTADEVWGTRFMHVTIAPLLIIIGTANPRFEWRKHVPLAVLGALGVAISFLGAFYYYGVRGFAAENARQNTMEWLDGDGVWNEIRFDARLFSVWLKGGTEPVPWTPVHVWVWTAPPDAQPWKTVNLRDYAAPQSFLLYFWKTPLEGSNLLIFRLCWVSLVLGPLLLGWVTWRTIKGTPAATLTPALTLTKDEIRG
jgi:hypothetical protein